MAEPMELMDALREVLKNSIVVEGITRGKLFLNFNIQLGHYRLLVNYP